MLVPVRRNFKVEAIPGTDEKSMWMERQSQRRRDSGRTSAIDAMLPASSLHYPALACIVRVVPGTAGGEPTPTSSHSADPRAAVGAARDQDTTASEDVTTQMARTSARRTARADSCPRSEGARGSSFVSAFGFLCLEGARVGGGLVRARRVGVGVVGGATATFLFSPFPGGSLGACLLCRSDPFFLDLDLLLLPCEAWCRARGPTWSFVCEIHLGNAEVVNVVRGPYAAPAPPLAPGATFYLFYAYIPPRREKGRLQPGLVDPTREKFLRALCWRFSLKTTCMAQQVGEIPAPHAQARTISL
ncbi:hypothetical protein DFH08DRAFT_999915 [Mycena albidolilacea]|uniref:Uncharacterized protein n=1 Tax=Mycena albidolilacea TaxID=1033008 RepID=A0AAD7A2T6_9AGAR|nr:hypothetical protein DFH08DRAFT_999915 [Mycena albidolilacea]